MNEILREICELSNGIRLINFSSPHEFLFEDGSILKPVHPKLSKELMLESFEEEKPHKSGAWTDIKLSYKMSDAVKEDLTNLYLEWQHDLADYNICIVPLPVLEEWNKMIAGIAPNLSHPFRTCRMKDRVSKTHYIDKFCL